MPVRTTVDIPDPLHDRLRNRAEKSGTSIRSLIVRAIEQTYPDTNKSGDCLTRPLIQGSGKLGPAFPQDENPHDFVFS
jgi:metal-responsive CopG/Arc/MetJ family transcriptional regulator